MLSFHVTPENRVILELLIVVGACLVAMIMEHPGQATAKADSHVLVPGEFASGD